MIVPQTVGLQVPPQGNSESGIGEDEAGIRLLNVAILFASHKWLISMLTVLGLACGVTVALIMPERFTSQMKVMPPQQMTSFTAMLMNQPGTIAGSSLGALTTGGLSLRNPNAIYIGMLDSRPVADAIIQKFDLLNAFHAKDMTGARQRLARETEIASEKEGFISITVTDTDRERAAGIANGYAEELRTITQGLAASEATQRKLYYEDQLRQAKDSLVDAELAFERVQQAHGLVQFDAQARTVIEGLASVRAVIAQKEVSLQALRSYSTERNPEVQIAEHELASLKEEADRMEGSTDATGHSGMALKDLSSAGLEYVRAEHEVKYRQALLDLLIKQYDGAKLDESKQAAIIQVLEPAIVAERRSSPHRRQVVLTATFAGFLLSCAWMCVTRLKQSLLKRPTVVGQLQRLRASVSRKHSSSLSTREVAD